MDAIVISFGDSFLRQSDIDTLDFGEWVNDAIISFFFTETFPRRKRGTDSESVGWLSPPAVELMCSIAGDMGAEAAQLLPPLTNTWTLLPASDRYSSGSSGTHWSALLIRRGASGECERAVHYDALRPRNSTAASAVATAWSLVTGNEPIVEEDESLPRQTNACDCGIYVLLIGSHLCPNSDKQAGAWNVDTITSQAAATFRLALYDWLRRWAAIPRSVQAEWSDLSDVVKAIGPTPW